MKKVLIFVAAVLTLIGGCDKDPLKPAPVAQVKYEITGYNLNEATIGYNVDDIFTVPGSSVLIPWQIEFTTSKCQRLELTVVPLGTKFSIAYLKIYVNGKLEAQAQGGSFVFCRYELIVK
jgi:hypothetical protein